MAYIVMIALSLLIITLSVAQLIDERRAVYPLYRPWISNIMMALAVISLCVLHLTGTI